MVNIENSLHDLHSYERQQREQGESLPTNGASTAAIALIPFASIDLVSEGSPAANAERILLIKMLWINIFKI